MLEIRHIEEHLRLALLDLKAFGQEQAGLGKRELEKKGSEALLKGIFGNTEALYYDEHNKPHLKYRPGHISISHSHDRMALLYNSKESTGVDMELLRDKVSAIQHKFLNEEEKAWAANDTETLICFWAVKESLYKVYGKKGVDFKKHLHIEKCHENLILASIRIEGQIMRYELVREKIADYILVYVSKKI